MKIDLHLHSHFSSDGIHKIALLTRYYSAGDIVSITDHETIAGWSEFGNICLDNKLIPIYGIEWFACKYHILSYFPTQNVPVSFSQFMFKRRADEKITMEQLAKIYSQQYETFPNYEKLINLKTHPEGILGLMVLGCKLRKIKNVDFKTAINELR